MAKRTTREGEVSLDAQIHFDADGNPVFVGKNAQVTPEMLAKIAKDIEQQNNLSDHEELKPGSEPEGPQA